MLTEVSLRTLATCANPQDQVSDFVQVLDFIKPAVEESTVTFVCPLGKTLSGPNISMCTNGTWVPDPRNLQCSGE
jgi:hypothetical protein